MQKYLLPRAKLKKDLIYFRERYAMSYWYISTATPLTYGQVKRFLTGNKILKSTDAEHLIKMSSIPDFEKIKFRKCCEDFLNAVILEDKKRAMMKALRRSVRRQEVDNEKKLLKLTLS